MDCGGNSFVGDNSTGCVWALSWNKSSSEKKAFKQPNTFSESELGDQATREFI